MARRKTRVTDVVIDDALQDITTLCDDTRNELRRRLKLIAEVRYWTARGDLDRVRTLLLQAVAGMDVPWIREPLGNDGVRYETVGTVLQERVAGGVPDDPKQWAQIHLTWGEGVPHTGEIWQHYKGGFYSITTTAIDENMLEPIVIYHSNARATNWGRTFDNWTEIVCGADGKPVVRFTRVTG